MIDEQQSTLSDNFYKDRMPPTIPKNKEFELLLLQQSHCADSSVPGVTHSNISF